MKTVTYKNRYNDKIIFTQINSHTIEMIGGEYIRHGYSNDYDKAYEAFHNDFPKTEMLSKEDFIQELFKYNSDTGEYKNPEWSKYRILVTSTEEIDMIDPSGGPYLTIGTDMSKFGLEGKIKAFTVVNNKYFINIE